MLNLFHDLCLLYDFLVVNTSLVFFMLSLVEMLVCYCLCYYLHIMACLCNSFFDNSTSSAHFAATFVH
jgi:hypothetical protein